jgi:hypothetical protein
LASFGSGLRRRGLLLNLNLWSGSRPLRALTTPAAIALIASAFKTAFTALHRKILLLRLRGNRDGCDGDQKKRQKKLTHTRSPKKRSESHLASQNPNVTTGR